MGGQCAPNNFFQTVLLPIMQKIKLVISVVFLTPLSTVGSIFCFCPLISVSHPYFSSVRRKAAQVVEPDAVLLNLKFLTARLWHRESVKLPVDTLKCHHHHCKKASLLSPSAAFACGLIGCGGAVIAPSADVRMRRFVAFA